MPEYSPSVFSRMIAMSTPSCRDDTPGRFCQPEGGGGGGDTSVRLRYTPRHTSSGPAHKAVDNVGIELERLAQLDVD